ncbi:MAG: TIGR04076 family protein [Anaerolineaceae bacterium]|nr:TIGR04076 family protein [Anaerolineaceae bacterium]
MQELKISVSKIMGTCTSDPPMECGDYFTVSNGDIRIPQGSFCLWALNSIMPLIPAKERKLGERDDDWMWRVHHAQCPDPNGKVIMKIKQVGEVNKEKKINTNPLDQTELPDIKKIDQVPGKPRNLRVFVKEVNGKCTSGMKAGDYFILRSGRMILPADSHFCLYALQVVIPFLAAKQRYLEDGDWLKDDSEFICSDPAGNVLMRVEQI